MAWGSQKSAAVRDNVLAGMASAQRGIQQDRRVQMNAAGEAFRNLVH